MILACFEPSAMKDPHHNFVVHALMIIKLGTGMELDVFHTMVTKNSDNKDQVESEDESDANDKTISCKEGLEGSHPVTFTG